MPLFHSEPYLQLAGLSHKAALIAWGAFYFRLEEGKDKIRELVDDSRFGKLHPPRRETIGALSESYGPAEVRVFKEEPGYTEGSYHPKKPNAGRPYDETKPVFVELVPGVPGSPNHCWVPGLSADTAYWYEVWVRAGKELEQWASGERWDWDASKRSLTHQGGGYINRFRTFPEPDESTPPVRFAVLGDFGVGVKEVDEGNIQRTIAAALTRKCIEEDARLVISTGDNVYGRGLRRKGSSGDEDDDWFFTFFQPYRYLINRVPFFPCVGNHDARETEGGHDTDNEDLMDDREQVMDNFYIAERLGLRREGHGQYALGTEEAAGRASVGPGLFYRFGLGKDLELVCLDSSKEEGILGGLILGGSSPDGFKDRLFLHGRHKAFIERTFGRSPSEGPKWMIPFFHHPLYCSGPKYGNTPELDEKVFFHAGQDAEHSLTDLMRLAGVRLVLNGHEHNLQHARNGDLHCIVTGGGAKVRSGLFDKPKEREAGHLESWAETPHFLVVSVTPEKLEVQAFTSAGNGESSPVRRAEFAAGKATGGYSSSPILIE